ncbi:hypothetical protein GCM10023184_36530 [Flaviaesturariibacter amylovorans]|uniref:Uncharacterized protein n=2 Tax=Flaviaesturariibacter amylovorans TaxID=1084520 RepID=A0ABP8HHK3_9BACT
MLTDTYIDNTGKGGPTLLKSGGTFEFTFDTLKPATSQTTYVTPWAAREMIQDLLKADWDNEEKGDKIIAVEFDKQALLQILSQNGCEGIRFSLCRFNERDTLVAFGISGDGTLIGEEMFLESFVPASAAPPPGSEQGHGITLRAFKEKLARKSGEGFTGNPGDVTDMLIKHKFGV